MNPNARLLGESSDATSGQESLVQRLERYPDRLVAVWSLPRFRPMGTAYE